jgi:hypothetical protein
LSIAAKTYSGERKAYRAKGLWLWAKASTSVSRAWNHNCALIGAKASGQHVVNRWRCPDQVQPPVELLRNGITLLVTFNAV